MKRKNVKIIICNFVLALTLSMAVCLADGDEKTGGNLLLTLENLKSLMFAAVTVVGLLIALFGVVQFGLSFQTHDPSQKSQGLMGLVGGAIVACAPWIVGYLLGV